jgi:hypothetical protein
MLPFLRYKDQEPELQRAFGKVPISVERITGTDHYYTDGDSMKSEFKVVIGSVITVYLPQFIYNVEPLHEKLIKEWLELVEKKENS